MWMVENYNSQRSSRRPSSNYIRFIWLSSQSNDNIFDSCYKHRSGTGELSFILNLPYKCSQMLINRCLRLCGACKRVINTSTRGRRGWRTLTGHTGLNHANVTAAPRRLFHGNLGDLYKDESVQKHVEQLMEEYRDLNKKLRHVYLSESDRKVLIKRHAELLPVANAFQSAEQAHKDLEEVLTLLQSE